MLEVAFAATGAQLERICRGFRRATEIEAEAGKDRYVRARPLGNGLVKLEVVVAADEADLVLKAIEHSRQGLSPAHDSSPRPSAADAIVHMAALQLTGGKASAGAPPAPDRCQVVIHVDRDLTASDTTLRAELDDGTHVAAETLRRVCCDGGVVTAVVDETGQVLDIGRRTRAIPAAIRRALWIRDQGCRFPGCANERFLHGHHLQHWLHGGRTSLDNLVMLCSFHHRQIHEGGFSIRLAANGDVEVRAPGGALLSAASDVSADIGGVVWQSDRWDGDIATPSWDGEPVDYDAVVGALTAA